MKKGGKMPSIKTVGGKKKDVKSVIRTAKEGVFSNIRKSDNPYGGSGGDPTAKKR